MFCGALSKLPLGQNLIGMHAFKRVQHHLRGALFFDNHPVSECWSCGSPKMRGWHPTLAERGHYTKGYALQDSSLEGVENAPD